MIKTAIRCPNNMVMVFDERGEQISGYQRQNEKVKESILKDALSTTVFGYLSDFKPEVRGVPREKW